MGFQLRTVGFRWPTSPPKRTLLRHKGLIAALLKDTRWLTSPNLQPLCLKGGGLRYLESDPS